MTSGLFPLTEYLLRLVNKLKVHLYYKRYLQIKIVNIFGICQLQLTNRRICDQEIRNICSYKDYLCNNKLFGFVKMASRYPK